MANGHGGKRPGAGRKKKVIQETPAPQIEVPSASESQSLEEMLNRLIKSQTGEQVTQDEFKKLAHEVLYMRQELEFIKKIILVSAGGKPK